MNCVYRLIWNEVLGAFVAVAEFVRSRSKRGGTTRGAALAASLCTLAAGPAHALPTGEQVAAGSVDVARPATNQLVVTQHSDQAIVNWRSFSIDANETTRFVQPTATSVILNRVLGGDASHIFGRLESNGIVFLSNPNGVIFARGAQVDVSGLVATTLGISDRNFLARNFSFVNAGNAGGIVNEADIKAGNGGYVALIAPTVGNAGTITATGGSAGLAAGDKVVLDFDHDGRITFKIDVPAAAARIDHTGVIAVDGGRVVMNASAKDALMSTVLNSGGTVRARSLANKNGEIVLDGGAAGVVSVAGTLDASGREAGQTGGSVKVLGDKVGLFAQAKIDVSGDAGGGTANVGGNYQGRGPDRNASATFVDRDASIAADALANGDGGNVVVWSDGGTQYRGSISARGGAQGGNGGAVEVSGKSGLIFDGTVNTIAAMGKTGTLLLDPTNLRICDNTTPGCANASINGATPFQPTAAGSQLSWQTIDAALAVSAVEVKTTAGFDAGEAGNIDIATGYGYNSANNLTITAANNIAFASGANVANAGTGGLYFVTTGTGSVYLVNAQISTGGKVSVNAAGNLTSSGGLISAGSTASDAVTLSARNIGTATTPIAVTTPGGIALSSRGEINLGTAVSQGTRAVAATTAALNREAPAVAVATKDATANIHVAGAVSPTLKADAAAIVSAPAAVQPLANAPAAGEDELWREIGSAILPKDVVHLCESFLNAHPGSAHADSARAIAEGARLAAASLRVANLTSDAVKSNVDNAAYRADLAKAMRGDKDAAYRIALMYRDGSGGIETNARRAENWLRVAAELGNGIASRQLAEYYGSANMVAEASRYERRALELGYPQLQRQASRG